MRPASRIIAVALCALVAPLQGQRQDDAADAARLVEVLGLKPGSVVADIGAGAGELTVRLAREVGAAGRVFATDVNPQRLKDISAAVAQAQLQNVTVLEGGSARTNLPEACCDAVFMRHVYHHLGDLAAMNESLRASVRPGGRVAVIDFEPGSGRSAPAGRRDTNESHGVMAEDVIAELKAAGFTAVQQLPWPSQGYFLVAGSRPQ